MKFESERDEILFTVAVDPFSWADKTGGDSSDGPIGWFATVAIDPSEDEDFRQALVEMDVELDGRNTEDFHGFWLIRESTDGPVTVQKFETREKLDRAWDELWAVLMDLRCTK